MHKVHRITSGLPTHALDVEQELRLAHFKKPENGPWFIPKCPRCKEKMFAGSTPVRDGTLAALSAGEVQPASAAEAVVAALDAFGRQQGKAVNLVDAASTG